MGADPLTHWGPMWWCSEETFWMGPISMCVMKYIKAVLLISRRKLPGVWKVIVSLWWCAGSPLSGIRGERGGGDGRENSHIAQAHMGAPPSLYAKE